MVPRERPPHLTAYAEKASPSLLRRNRMSPPTGNPAKILDAAAKEIGCKGYAAASITGIVLRAGVSRPTLYYYFRSKQGLHGALLQRAKEELDGVVTRAMKCPGTSCERIAQLCAGAFRALRADACLRLTISEGPSQYSNRASTATRDSVLRTLAGAFAALLEEGQQAGLFRKLDLEDASWLLVGLLLGPEPSKPKSSLHLALQRRLRLVLDGFKAGRTLDGRAGQR